MNLRSWHLELLALLGASALFVGLIILLVVFDKSPVFKWYDITLNTIISIMAVSMKALLIHATTECTAQWKWIIFSQSKQTLWAFERIDTASRGLFGSITLAFRRDTPLLLRLGAITITLSVAVDPLSQQLIRVEQAVEYRDTVNGQSALTPRATTYRLGSVNRRRTPGSCRNATHCYEATVDYDMETAIMTGLSRPLEAIQRDSSVACPTGNCTWPQFESLAVCHRCADLSSKLRLVEGMGDVFDLFLDETFEERFAADSVSAWVLPNGHFIPNVNGCSADSMLSPAGCKLAKRGMRPSYTYPMAALGTGNPRETTTMQDIQTMIWSLSVIHVNEVDKPGSAGETAKNSELPSDNWPNTPLTAIECAIYYCVKAIDIHVESNRVLQEEKEIKEFKRDPDSWTPREYPFPSLSQGWDYERDEIPRDMQSLEFDGITAAFSMSDLILHNPNATDKPAFKVAQLSVQSLSRYFQQMLETDFDLGHVPGGFRRAQERIPQAFKPPWLFRTDQLANTRRHVGSIWRSPRSNVSAQFEALTRSMTNEIRHSGGRNNSFDTWVAPDSSVSMFQSTTEQVPGRVGVLAIFYRPAWKWISVHSIVFVGGVVFCLLTMHLPNRQTTEDKAVRIWKSSSLAIIAYGQSMDAVFQEAHTLADIERIARQESI
jgi:hypothetical protein